MQFLPLVQQFVLLHGWGASRQLMQPLAQALQSFAPVQSWALPGYPGSSWPHNPLPFATCTSMAKALPPDSILVGWSLGGLHALQIAACSQRVQGVILIAALPYFLAMRQKRGISQDLLNNLKQKIEVNADEGFNFFWKLHGMGSQALRQQYRMLLPYLQQTDKPEKATLLTGLLELNVDMRQYFSDLTCPVLGFYGDQDFLIHEDIAKFQFEINELSQFKLIKGAGHVPFLTHLEKMITMIDLFFNKK